MSKQRGWGMTPRRTVPLDYDRQSVKGVFFCKNTVNQEDCRQLVQDLGCMILQESASHLMVQTSRERLKLLKERHLSEDDDKAQISSRLKHYFERILIGGSV
jgi:hypothetical protein